MNLEEKHGRWSYPEPFIAFSWDWTITPSENLFLKANTQIRARSQTICEAVKTSRCAISGSRVLEGWWDRNRRIKDKALSKLRGERLTVSAPERRGRAVDGDRRRVETMWVPLRVRVRGGRYRTHGCCYRVSGVPGWRRGAPHRTSDTSQSQKPHP